MNVIDKTIGRRSLVKAGAATSVALAAPPHFVRSCLEGPVFDAGRIVWEALAH